MIVICFPPPSFCLCLSLLYPWCFPSLLLSSFCLPLLLPQFSSSSVLISLSFPPTALLSSHLSRSSYSSPVFSFLSIHTRSHPSSHPTSIHLFLLQLLSQYCSSSLHTPAGQILLDEDPGPHHQHAGPHLRHHGQLQRLSLHPALPPTTSIQAE